jgi:N-acetylneuraminic acid mutarotase
VALLGAVLSACASGEDPSATPSSPAPTPATASGEVVGPPTASEDHPEWEGIEGLQVPRDDFGAAVVGTDIWTMGGMTGERGNRLVSIEILDTETDRWRGSRIEMPVGLASFEMVAIGPRIYAFGGFDEESRPTAFAAVLDTRSGRWRDLPRLPHARYAHTVTAYDGRLYVIGGRDQEGAVVEVDVFDPRSATWTTTDTPMAHARDSHDTVVTPDGLMVVGGWLDYEPTDLVDLYDPATDSWSEGPSTPEPVSRAGVASVDGRVWVSYHELSYVLDLASGEWEDANALPLARHGLGYVHVGDAIYAIGGCALNPLRDVRTTDRLELDPA